MMRMQLVLAVVIGVFALGGLPCSAQEKKGPPEEVVPPKKEAVPVVTVEAAPCGPACASRPTSKVLWVEREVPIQTIFPREETTYVLVTTFEVAYRAEKQTVIEMVLKPREVEKLVTSCTVKPVEVIDPSTGQCSIVHQPCTEVKLVKQTEFVAVAEKKEVDVQVPYLKKVERKVPQKTVLLEYGTEMRKIQGAVRVPGNDEPPPVKMLLAPKPPCPQ